jgi:hypothetical protein
MKKAAIYAKLSAPAEQVRLNILTCPRSFPALVIRGPISWHTNVQLAKHNLDHNLFILNQVIVKLNQLCVDEFRDKFIVPREALEKVRKLNEVSHSLSGRHDRRTFSVVPHVPVRPT